MTPEATMTPTVDTMIPTVDMKTVESFGVPGTKPVDTMIPTVDLKETPVFPSIPSSQPFTMKDIKKAIAMTVVKESPTLTAVAASGLVAGTAMSGGNPVLGMVVSKLAPLGYVGYKAAEMAMMDPRAFWNNMADLEADLIKSEPSFWRGVGQEYAFGIARKYGPEAQGAEAVGEMAGMILRDFVVAAGIGRVVMGAARGAQFAEALRSADKGIRMAAHSQLALAKGLAFSGSMGLDQGIDRYYTEVGAGTNEKLAMQAAIATGIASGASGVVFMGMLPAVTAKYGARMFGSYPIPKKMLMSSAEWSGWVGMDQSVKNMIRERVYGLKPDDEMTATDLAKVAGIGAAFSLGGALVAASLSRGGRSVNMYVGKKIQERATAKEMAEKAQKIDIPDITGTEVNTPKVTEEFAAATGTKKDDGSIKLFHGTANEFDEFSAESLGSNTGARSAKEGFFFTTNFDLADTYAQEARASKWKKANPDKAARKNQLEMEPLENNRKMTDAEKAEYDSYVKEIHSIGPSRVVEVSAKPKNPLIVDMGGKQRSSGDFTKLAKKAKAKGHDALIIKNTHDDPYEQSMDDIYIVFDKSILTMGTDYRLSRGDVGSFVGPQRMAPDFSAHKLTAVQTTEIVDRARELMNNGLDDKVALEQAWEGVPSELKNPENLASCLQALRAGQ